MRFVLPIQNLDTGAVADTYVTLAALIAADTAGHRCRLRAICVGPSDDAPDDKNCSVQVIRIADVSAGTAGTKTNVTAAAMPRPDSGQRDGVITGGLDYTVEPTTYETYPLWQMDFNIRSGFLKEWPDVDAAPQISRDQLLGFRFAPRAAAAVTVSGTIEFEEF